MNKFLLTFRTCLLVCTFCLYTPILHADTSVFQTKIDGANFAVSKNAENGSYNIQISANGKIEVLDIFDLANPSRLVIDLKHINISRNGNFSISNDQVFSQMRVGKHNDKIRLVLDLKTAKVPQYTWEPLDNSSINIFLSNIDAKLTRVAKTQEAELVIPKQQAVIEAAAIQDPTTQATRPKVDVEASIKQQEIIEAAQPNEAIKENTKLGELKQIQETTDTEIEQAEIEEPIKAKADDLSPQGLENIKFYYQKEKNTPLVRFIMVKKPEYRLKKESEKKYILTIPDCNIRWPHLELPQFPPRDFRGFTMVMPEKSGSDLNIAIGIERGGSISSFTKNNEIWLKAN